MRKTYNVIPLSLVLVQKSQLLSVFFKAKKVNPKIKISKCLIISIFIKNICTPAL